ncbi:MAG: hypothetical protein HXY39_09465 [Chloroflexi bacterium]|nr:hypothetical protein [Chloroflexota bacterium]
MTIGWTEGLIILIILAFVIGLAFRGGYQRGRMRRSGAVRKKDDDVTAG